LASVELRGLTKRFGSLAVVDDVSLVIDHGKLVCLLGPSGCGKTTTLRLIAGFLEPSSGEIRVGERVVSSRAKTLPPEQRKMSMIFQSYALWPHMTVAENITYGLRLRKLDRDTTAKKLKAILQTTKLEALAERYPGELSGGQQQRVALARALVVEPETLLLDEPLSNLDAKLRASARLEIKQFQQRVGVTTIYVTHDQVEAMGMGDRIAVMDHGRVRQVGTPAEVYDDPADRFVATFVGTPPMNLLARNGTYLGFRPENFLPRDMIDGNGGVTEFSFRVDRSEYLGSERIVYGVIDGFATQVITAKLPQAHVAKDSIRPGEWHAFAVRNSALHCFDRDGKRTNRH